MKNARFFDTGHLARARATALAGVCLGLGLSVIPACQDGGHDLRDTTVPMTAQGFGTIGVGVYDRRPYILKLDRTPAFVGFQYVEDQSPRDVETANGRPLADDWNAVIARSLRSRNYDAQAVVISAIDKPETALRKLRGLGTRTSILVTMRDWKFITTATTRLYFDLSLQVIDKSGVVLAEKVDKGEEDLGSGDAVGAVAMMKAAQAMMPGALKTHLDRLLNDPKVAGSIK